MRAGSDNSIAAEGVAALGEQMPLRLVAWGGGLGIELYEPRQLGPLVVTELVWSLPGVTFPVDLSGGVRGFRSRRGELSTLRVAAAAPALAQWLHQRLRESLGGLTEQPRLWPVPGGLGLGLQGGDGVLAFELLWSPEGATARWVVSRARSAGLGGVPLTAALRVVSTVFGPVAQRRGRVFEIPEAASKIVQNLLPLVGVRAPSTSRTQLGQWDCIDGVHSVAVAEQPPPPLTDTVQRNLHLAALLEAGDDALVSGETDAARAAYLAALERAPRHPEICLLIATIDVEFGERRESALGLLVESLPATSFGAVGARLLASTGDWHGSRLALDRAAAEEAYAPLVARLWVVAAELAPDGAARREALDLALAASAGCREARFQRFTLRVELGDVNGARADAEHLEAQALGSAARHSVVVHCGQALLTAGYPEAAGRYFERALRYRPEDEAGALGLALVLLETGRPERASPLLARAVQSPQARVAGRARVALGRVLAEHLRDIPQAISQVRRVDAESGQLLLARSLEARWRASLGDLAGAALCYSNVRELAELGLSEDPTLAVETLRAAAEFARRELLDLRVAERHLATALRLAPQDQVLGAEYRRLAREAQLTLPGAQAPEENPGQSPPNDAGEDLARSVEGPSDRQPSPHAASDASFAVEPEPAALSPLAQFKARFDSLSEEERELQAEDLRGRYLAAPGSGDTFEQLRYAFMLTGKHVELHALLCAAYEDGEGEERAELLQQLCSTLEQLRDLAPDDVHRELYEAQLQDLNAES